MVPTIVVGVQIRLHSLSPQMTGNHIVNESLQQSALASERAECQRLHASRNTLVRVLGAREPYLERPASVPEPMLPRRRNHRYALVAYGRVQVEVPDSRQKLLLQKPFFDPHERRIVISDCDDHRRLAHDPVPDGFRHTSQPDAYATDNH